MIENNELERLRTRAGSTAELARILGLHRTHMHRQYRKGYLSSRTALIAHAAYPDLDVAALIRRPKGE